MGWTGLPMLSSPVQQNPFKSRYTYGLIFNSGTMRGTMTDKVTDKEWQDYNICCFIFYLLMLYSTSAEGL